MRWYAAVRSLGQNIPDEAETDRPSLSRSAPTSEQMNDKHRSRCTMPRLARPFALTRRGPEAPVYDYERYDPMTNRRPSIR